MPDLSLDRDSLIFFFISLVIACWAVFDTERFFSVLSLGRKNGLSRWEQMAIKVPGMIVVLGLTFLILFNLFHKR
jgi:hypothetical protein